MAVMAIKEAKVWRAGPPHSIFRKFRHKGLRASFAENVLFIIFQPTLITMASNYDLTDEQKKTYAAANKMYGLGELESTYNPGDTKKKPGKFSSNPDESDVPPRMVKKRFLVVLRWGSFDPSVAVRRTVNNPL